MGFPPDWVGRKNDTESMGSSLREAVRALELSLAPSSPISRLQLDDDTLSLNVLTKEANNVRISIVFMNARAYPRSGIQAIFADNNLQEQDALQAVAEGFQSNANLTKVAAEVCSEVCQTWEICHESACDAFLL